MAPIDDQYRRSYRNQGGQHSPRTRQCQRQVDDQNRSQPGSGLSDFHAKPEEQHEKRHREEKVGRTDVGGRDDAGPFVFRLGIRPRRDLCLWHLHRHISKGLAVGSDHLADWRRRTEDEEGIKSCQKDADRQDEVFVLDDKGDGCAQTSAPDQQAELTRCLHKNSHGSRASLANQQH